MLLRRGCKNCCGDGCNCAACCCTFPMIDSCDDVGAKAKQNVPAESTGINRVMAVPESTMIPPFPKSSTAKSDGETETGWPPTLNPVRSTRRYPG
ncbi:protein ASPARTIC PROTEASE IN GUARD CELL 1-like [Pyrus ussuriensis x Pyrus communis]|uniref:Protein ASPARTIC PROTEASE IN GUARD CELL 1-like n=1 Tax=Pyrus ussuriensis x Pyrus communis TaxID=2448454 RepID=A0A5N5F752_9ROSA|nr:protein ASPARTIC PROTEASE IN GUARD CELL 1-like [Pyrus ussuriensis x Pyrus communis]